MLIPVIFDENWDKNGKKVLFFRLKKRKNECFRSKNGVKNALICGFLAVFEAFLGFKMFHLFRLCHLYRGTVIGNGFI